VIVKDRRAGVPDHRGDPLARNVEARVTSAVPIPRPCSCEGQAPTHPMVLACNLASYGAASDTTGAAAG